MRVKIVQLNITRRHYLFTQGLSFILNNIIQNIIFLNDIISLTSHWLNRNIF